MAGLGDVLDYVGSSIDKPGRAVRGLLAGKPQEAAAILPFSDTLGITKPEDRVSGRQLTDKLGITRSGDKGWGSWGLGLGAEMATDPLSYIPAHSVFKYLGFANKGKAARAASHLGEGTPALKRITPADYASMARDEGTPLGRLFSLADAAGVNVWPHGATPNVRVPGGRYKDVAMTVDELPKHIKDWDFPSYTNLGGDRYAQFSTLRDYGGVITPNTERYPELWSDLGAMKKEMGKGFFEGHFSGVSPEHIATHEIAHALHQRNLNKIYPRDADLGNWLYDRLKINPDSIQRSGDHWLNAPGLEDLYGQGLYRPTINHLSGYATKNPAEFIAEAFARHADEVASGYHNGIRPMDIPPELNDLYRQLHGPTVPEDLSIRLKQYLGQGTPSLATAVNPGASSSAGPVSGLRALREQIPIVKGVGTANERIIGGTTRDIPRVARANQLFKASGMHGVSMPPWADWQDAAGAAFVRNPRAGREETLHAITQRAAHQNNIGPLPHIARPAAHMYRAANATGSQSLAGLAQVLDELSAKTMAGRGTAGKLGAAADFLFNPATHAAYGPHFGRFGVIPRAAYHGVPLAIEAAPMLSARLHGLPQLSEE